MTTFVNGTTLTDSTWFNDLERLNYTIFANPADVTTARLTLLAGMNKIENVLGSAVALNDISSYFTGPIIAQGTAGTWLVQGKVCIVDTSIAAAFAIKLWDGTTVIDSAYVELPMLQHATVSLSGYLVTPGASIRISVRNLTSTNGLIQYNVSGNLKDSTLKGIRVG